MRNEFHAGDVVIRKGGGPKMTVDVVDEQRGAVACIWIENGRPRGGSFPVLQLEPYRPQAAVNRPQAAAGKA
jgi:uncharacterized protein YodC (DUF2158 family)